MLSRLTLGVLSSKTPPLSLFQSKVCRLQTLRLKSTGKPSSEETIRNFKIRSTLYYVTAAGVLAAGLSYAAVPLYRMFCQVRLFNRIEFRFYEFSHFYL